MSDVRKQRTRTRILASAARVLRGSGIAGATVAQVMAGAGLTVGGFYAHFATKEELVEEGMRQAMREVWTRIVEWAARAEGPSERLDLLMRQYLSRSHRDRAAEGCPLPAVVSELATAGSPRLRVALADELRARADSIYDLHPSIRGVSAGQAALATVALFYGGLALSRATAGTPVSDDILRACRAYARTALRAFEQMSA